MFNVDSLPDLSQGTLEAPTAVCYGEDYTVKGGTVVGGNGSKTYTWQYSYDEVEWESLSNQSDEDLEVIKPKSGISYRRIVSDMCGVDTSNVVHIEVREKIDVTKDVLVFNDFKCANRKFNINTAEGVVFTDKGLYMAREFETGWQQIYFLSYDGKTFRRLTDGPNWNVTIVRVDEKKGDVYFTAKRDAVAKQALYKVDKTGKIVALTDPQYNATGISFSPNGKYFVASLSNLTTPTWVAVFANDGGVPSIMCRQNICAKTAFESLQGRLIDPAFPRLGKQKNIKVHSYPSYRLVADMKGPDYDSTKYALGELVYVMAPVSDQVPDGKIGDSFILPGVIVYPKNFDESKKYPVHVDIYGGPNTPQVRDRWVTPNASNQWYSENGIIQITVDPRAAGHNGRAGLDMIYRQLTVWEVKDFCAWAEWLQSLPYVKADKIGVEGFSFGGTMTAMLLMQAPDKFHYGIAGGGVYDWALYDSHYTERYMDTPQANPEGYEVSKTMNYVDGYPTEYSGEAVLVEPVMLKLTHGTGDDNVHHQNTLQLLDALHKEGKKFDFMIYPDGMHGYHGYQGAHFQNANNEFWLKYLKSE
jgi:dipeptidyl-peptidase-4